MRNINMYMAVCLVSLMTVGSLYAQEEREISFEVPEGTLYNRLPYNGKDVCIAIHPDGSTTITQDNTIFLNGKSIEMPSQIRPSAICWCDSRNLVIFSGDTIYLLSPNYSLQPLVEVTAKKIVIRAFVEGSFAFCAVGDTVIYQYDMQQKRIKSLFKYSMPISDFIVDGEDIFFATGKYVVAYLKEKQYIPIFQNPTPVWRIAFCGSESMFFSDNHGLWFVNKEREIIPLINQPVVDIVTDSNGQGFFKTSDGGWVFVYPTNNYEIDNKK